MKIDPEHVQHGTDDLLDGIASDRVLEPTEYLGKLIQRRSSGDLGKLTFREAAVRELVLLEEAVEWGQLSQDEYERWEQKVAELAYDSQDLAACALIESAFENRN